MTSGALLRRRTTLVAIFETQRALVEVVDRVLASDLDDVLNLGHAALLARDAQGELVTIDNSVSPREGAFSGAMLGITLGGLSMFLLGVLDLPDAATTLSLIVSLIIGGLVGSAIGRAVARLVGFGFEPWLLNSVAQRLEPGQVALLLQVRPANVPLLRRELGAHAELFPAAAHAAAPLEDR